MIRLKRPAPKRDQNWQLQLINIVFLLLLFFVTNGTISNIRDTRIELPVSVAVEGAAPVGDAAYVDQQGTVSFRSARHKPAEIAKLWGEDEGSGIARSMAAPFQVLVDRRLDARMMIGILQEFRAAGFENLSLVTLRETGHAQ